MNDPVLTYFAENLSTVSKEELLQALENALGSASYWRDACLLGSQLKTGWNKLISGDRFQKRSIDSH